jgi:hypothetical protein
MGVFLLHLRYLGECNGSGASRRLDYGTLLEEVRLGLV